MKLNRKITLISFIVCSLFVAGIFGYKDYINYNKKIFVVRMQSSNLAFAQVFFDVGHGYNEHDSCTIMLQSEKLYKYVFPLTNKTIKSIRFDPINGPALVCIKEARIENNQGEVIKKFPLQDFKPIQQISKMGIRGGVLILQTSEHANDPIVQIENSSINQQIHWNEYIAKRGWAIIGYGLLSFFALAALFYFVKIALTYMQYKKEKIIFIFSVLAIAFSLIIVVRWWYYIDAYSVNILFWDQWDFYTSFFENKNLWELFHLQFGPHRMGVGLLLTKAVASFSGWNTRAEDFAIGGVVSLAMIVALAIRAKLGPRLNWMDIAIPLIFLTPIQYEIFAGTPIPSHGAVPLLLLVLYCLVFVVWNGMARCVAILVLNFLLIYTGFGVFVGMITPCLFGVEAFRASRAHNRKDLWLALTGVVVSLLSAGSFFVGYQFAPGIESFQFPVREWWHYPQFMALMLANFCGVKGVTPVSYVVGFIVLFLMVALALIHMVRISRSMIETTNSSTDTVVAILTTFTLLFCANTAIGRVPLGLPSAQASRYITNMIPGFLGIYFWLTAMPPGVMRRILLTSAIAGLIIASFPLREADCNTLKWFAESKTIWKAVYLQTENIETATRAANFPIYPAPDRTHLKQKLEYLKKEKLNLYLDAPSLPLNQ